MCVNGPSVVLSSSYNEFRQTSEFNPWSMNICNIIIQLSPASVLPSGVQNLIGSALTCELYHKSQTTGTRNHWTTPYVTSLISDITSPNKALCPVSVSAGVTGRVFCSCTQWKLNWPARYAPCTSCVWMWILFELPPTILVRHHWWR